MKPPMPVFVRAKSGEAARPLVRAKGKEHPQADRANEPEFSVTAESDASLDVDGPFAPLGSEIVRNDAMRAALALEFRVPSLAQYAKLRLLAAALAVPLLWLIGHDARSYDLEHKNVLLLGDVLGLAALLYELARRTSHRRWIVAAVVLGANARIVDALAESCQPAVVPLAIALASTALLVFWLSRVASPRLVALEVLDALDVSVDSVLALPEKAPPSRAYVIATLAVGGVVPILARSSAGMAPLAAIAIFAMWALVAPAIASRVFEGPDRPLVPPLPKITPRLLASTALLGAIGFAGAVWLMHGVHQGFDAGAHLLRCRDAVSFESSGAKKQLLLETVERIQARARGRDTALAFATTALLAPLLHERVYRGFCQRVLTRRFSGTAGVFGSALLYAFAESTTYESLFYQSLAAGAAFGAVYAEGGVVAAMIAHVLYSTHLLL
jgi:membrane protease YdiL (CAAX protease family)